MWKSHPCRLWTSLFTESVNNPVCSRCCESVDLVGGVPSSDSRRRDTCCTRRRHPWDASGRRFDRCTGPPLRWSVLCCGSKPRCVRTSPCSPRRRSGRPDDSSVRRSHQREGFGLHPASSGTARQLCLTTIDGVRSEQAYFSAEQPQARQDARFPPAHEHPCRPCDPRIAPPQGTPRSVRLIVRLRRHPRVAS